MSVAVHCKPMKEEDMYYSVLNSQDTEQCLASNGQSINIF